ncbi:hypothetical protein COOONC_11485 [Cooperia oncophora]
MSSRRDGGGVVKRVNNPVIYSVDCNNLRVRFSSPASEEGKRRLRSPSPKLRPSPMHPRPTEDSRMAAGVNRQQSLDSSMRQDVCDGSCLHEEESTRSLPRSRSQTLHSRIPAPSTSYRLRNRMNVEEEYEQTPPRVGPIKRTTAPTTRRLRSESTQLNTSMSYASPLPVCFECSY